jgi:flagellar hook-basal body complex protein FliE
MAVDKIANPLATGLPGIGGSAPAGTKGPSFLDALDRAVQSTYDAQKSAEAFSAAVAQGQDVPMHQVVQAVAQAEITLQTMVSVRDRAVEAYQQILQMQI